MAALSAPRETGTPVRKAAESNFTAAIQRYDVENVHIGAFSNALHLGVDVGREFGDGSAEFLRQFADSLPGHVAGVVKHLSVDFQLVVDLRSEAAAMLDTDLSCISTGAEVIDCGK